LFIEIILTPRLKLYDDGHRSHKTMRKLSEFLLRRKTAQPADAQQEDYHAHMYLGNMYLALGDVTQAEVEYSRAYALSPSEESRKPLAAIRKRRTEQCYSADKYVATARAA